MFQNSWSKSDNTITILYSLVVVSAFLHLHPQGVKADGELGLGVAGDPLWSAGCLEQPEPPHHGDDGHLGLVQGEPHPDAVAGPVPECQEGVPIRLDLEFRCQKINITRQNELCNRFC